jgi:hypothetical protein
MAGHCLKGGINKMAEGAFRAKTQVPGHIWSANARTQEGAEDGV